MHHKVQYDSRIEPLSLKLPKSRKFCFDRVNAFSLPKVLSSLWGSSAVGGYPAQELAIRRRNCARLRSADHADGKRPKATPVGVVCTTISWVKCKCIPSRVPNLIYVLSASNLSGVPWNPGEAALEAEDVQMG